MDIFSHGLWSYVIWRYTPAPLLAVLCGILPDVIAQAPLVVENLSKKRHFKKILSKDVSAGARRYVQIAFPITHSMIIALVINIVVWIGFGFQWWLLAWPLHILIDMFTHLKHDATPFLWPISDFRLHGVHWAKKEFIIPNKLALLVAYAVIVF